MRGSQNGVLGNNKFIWHAAIVNGASYTSNTAGGQKPCAAVTSATAAAGPFTPYAPDYSVAVAIDPVNEANIIFEPPLAIPLPAGSFLGPAQRRDRLLRDRHRHPGLHDRLADRRDRQPAIPQQ